MPGDPLNYNPERGGVNRFATVFMYLTDVEEGGETVFTHAARDADEDVPSRADVHADLVRRNITGLFPPPPDNWEVDFIATCRTRLAVRPKRGTAVLFYTQAPSGAIDGAQMHGGCPVISGVKWAANLWLWNGPRYGPGAPETNPGKGQADDTDQEAQCPTWARRGECTKNPTYMLRHCAAACKEESLRSQGWTPEK